MQTEICAVCNGNGYVAFKVCRPIPREKIQTPVLTCETSELTEIKEDVHIIETLTRLCTVCDGDGIRRKNVAT
jgi:hypothetical protein